MSQNKKHLDFELNLIPFIDLLSTCICFLLLTAVWINVGSMNVKQAVGGQPASETVKKPILWVFLGDKGEMTLETRDAQSMPANMRKLKLAGADGKTNWIQLASQLDLMKKTEPELKTALIQPRAQTSYEDIIDLMDQFKKSGLGDLGVVPL
ncbi:MAG: biopolymer transporter ExbD [Bdellovibrionaceae bacterium]|nr:biopolymer transporter ExbD [Pseudobdellovibrionaceae bacterium]